MTTRHTQHIDSQSTPMIHLYRAWTLIIVINLFTLSNLSAQYNDLRYRWPIFDDVTVFQDIVYSQAIPFSLVEEDVPVDYAFDFYEPALDEATKRPLVMLFSDGGFVFGQKRSADMVTLCDSLARYGYACACIDYRQNFDATNPESMIRAMYRAVQDARSAVRYFKEYHATFRVDTSQIFIGGKRAGAIIALHTAFMDTEKERPAASYGQNDGRRDLGCLDCSGNPFDYSANVAGVINIGGALYDPSIIDNSPHIPALNIHAKNDNVIPIDMGHPFEQDFDNMFPLVYGSKRIHQRLDSLGFLSEFQAVEDQDEIYGFAAMGYAGGEVIHSMTDFINEALAFQTATPDGKYSVCEGLEAEYEVDGMPESTYEWTIENGRITQQNKNRVTVRWNSGIKEGKLQVTEISAGKVRGKASPKLVIQIKPQPSAEYELDYADDNTVVIYDQSVNGTFCSVDFDFQGNTASGKIGKSYTFSYPQSGDYMITQTVESQCGISVNQIPVSVEITKAVEQKLLEKAVSVFPNNLKKGEKISENFYSIDINLKYKFKNIMSNIAFLIYLEIILRIDSEGYV